MTLLTLYQQDFPARRVSVKEYAGPCPRCGGEDRFRLFLASARYWCRQCGAKGDTIQFLRDFRGYSYRDAARMAGKALVPDPRRECEREVERRLVQEYADWLQRTRTRITDHIRALNEERHICLLGLDLDREGEEHWLARLGEVYHECGRLEWLHELLVDPRYEAERVRWWEEER